MQERLLIMTVEEALQRVQEPGAADVLRPHWDESAALLGERVPPFLQPEAVTHHCQWCGFGPEVDAPLRDAAGQIASDPVLRLLAWHCERLLFVHTDTAGVQEWPSLERELGDLGGTFYLLVALAMAPRVVERHRTLGIAEDVTRATCLQVRCFAENYRRGTRGRLGIFRRQLYWLRHYPAGHLFRLGRMEYRLTPYAGGVDVYRHRGTDEVVALAPEGMRFNREGYPSGVTEEPAWLAARGDTKDVVVGCPISPWGLAVHREVSLQRDVWEPILTQGDDTLDMHIPAGGGMTSECCADSMRRAVR